MRKILNCPNSSISIVAALMAVCTPVTSKPTVTMAPLVVFDATGATVGRFGGFGGAPLLIASTPQLPAIAIQMLPIVESGAENTTKLHVVPSQVLFATPDCTGTAYTSGGNYFGAPTANVVEVAGTPYIYMPTTRILVFITIGSSLSSSGCSVSSGTRWAAPAAAPVPLSTMLTEPLGVR